MDSNIVHGGDDLHDHDKDPEFPVNHGDFNQFLGCFEQRLEDMKSQNTQKHAA